MIIYSTDSIYPIAVIGNIHYASINDLSWMINPATNEMCLIVASSDGYCSIISFPVVASDGTPSEWTQRLGSQEVPEKLRPSIALRE